MVNPGDAVYIIFKMAIKTTIEITYFIRTNLYVIISIIIIIIIHEHRAL